MTHVTSDGRVFNIAAMATPHLRSLVKRLEQDITVMWRGLDADRAALRRQQRMQNIRALRIRAARTKLIVVQAELLRRAEATCDTPWLNGFEEEDTRG